MAIVDMHQADWSPYFHGFTKLCEGSGMPAWLYDSSVLETSGGLDAARCAFFSNNEVANEKPWVGMSAVWSMLAGRYASGTLASTVIGADMFNEPWFSGGCKSADLASFYETMGKAIRSTNPHIILMYEDDAYQSYVNTGPRLLRQPKLSNALISWHFYPTAWDNTSQSQLAWHVNEAKNWGVPLWIGETDMMGETRTNNPGQTQNSQLTQQMNYFKANNISWTLWAYDTGCCHVVQPGTTHPKPALLSILKNYEYVTSPAPAVSISSPNPGNTVSGSVTVSATATVNTGSIRSVTLKANGMVLKTCNNASCSSSWNSTHLANGTYTVEAATVASDGKSSSATERVSVNNGPTVTIASPANNATVKGLVPIQATGSSDVVKSQVVWDGTHLIRNVTTTSIDQYGWGAQWNSTHAPNGSHTLTVTVWNAAGATKSASVNVKVKN